MSSEALMEKPMSGKCRCRTQSWYLVLISFLLWFALFYLYSSSVTFSKKGDSFIGNNHTGFVDSSSESFHDVAKDETGDSFHVKDINIGDNVEEDAKNQTEKEQKPVKFLFDEDDEIDRVIASLMSEDNETEPVDTISGKENEGVNGNTMDEDDKPVDLSSMKEKRKEDGLRNEGVTGNTMDEDDKPIDPSSMKEKRKEDGLRNDGVTGNTMDEDDKPVDPSSMKEKRKEDGLRNEGVTSNTMDEEDKPVDLSSTKEKRKEDVAKQKGTENVSELQREEIAEDQPVDSFPIVKSRRERAMDEDDKPIDLSSMKDKRKEDVAKQKGVENVSELQREEIAEDQPVDSFPIVKSRRERAKRPRRRNRNKPVDSSDPVMEKRIEKVVVEPRRHNVVRSGSESSSCSGRYIYIHNLPRKFNQDLLDNCRSLSFWTDMCECASNLGLGAPLPSDEKLYSRTGWFATNQFLLEVIFHNRMKQYKCLTKDPSVASAIYVPYYAGLDVGRYLWDPDGFMRDYDAVNLVKWLASRPEWKKMWGRDHFLVAGRINWDFRRDPKNESDWGNELLNFPESRNMTMLVIESSPWNNNDFAIPYPTYFHPSRDDDVFQWQNRMRRLKRRFLYSFAGARRPNLHESIRNEIIDQCLASRRKCKFLECDKTQKCHKPVYLMKLFQSSIFCLQPPGDSYTRRSIFDSILAGCIPVFFHPGSAYVQYIWHFPKDYTKYSVLIPASDVKAGKANIERTLQRIPREKRAAMREEIIRLIPKVIYADPSSRLETIEDAFDLTVKGVLDRVETVRKQMRDGKEVNSEFDEEESWKYFAFGKLGVHEWDPFFSSKLGKRGT